jgi:hypothetical protein
MRYDIGLFGKNNPETLERESLGFIILANPQRDFIRILPLFHGHVTQTAAVAAGRGFFGGKMDGAAPGAQVASLLLDPGVSGQIEGMIQAVKSPKVDTIAMQYVFLMRLNDGNSTESVIFDRLVEKYQKPIFVSANNSGPGLNTGAENAAGGRVISVGGYVHKDTWRSNYGLEVERDEYVINLSSRGPRKDGGFKPDILAPAVTITADNYSGIYPDTTPRGVSYKLPPGYVSSYGTSFASPIAAGGVALLISAAKQTGIPYDAERLRWAIKSSARYLPEWNANEQGAGLMQVESAWEFLKHAPQPIEITSRATINAAMSQHLKEPHEGVGIYEREGWAAGQSDQRTIKFIRTTGEESPVTYNLRWIGNDGTFSSPATINLPLNTPIALPVMINPKRSGVHSAILSLDDPESAHSVYEVMNTVVAAEQFTPENGFTVIQEGQADYPSYASYFFNVPAGVSAFKVDLKTIGDKNQIGLRLMTPAGVHSNSSPFQKTSNLTVAKPEPGVWEIIVDNGNDGRWIEQPKEAQTRTNFSLSASVYGVETNAAVKVIETTSTDSILDVNFENHFAAFTGGILETPLSSAFSAQPTLIEGDKQQIYEVNVPAGSTKLSASIKSASDSGADLDLYLYDCTSSPCRLKSFSVHKGSQKTVSIDNPSAGMWKVVIDPVSIPSGKTSIEYTDCFTNPVFGYAKPVDPPVARKIGEIWTEKIKLRAEAMPLRQRYLMSIIEVGSSEPDVVKYQFNPTTKTSDSPVQQLVALGMAMVAMKTN